MAALSGVGGNWPSNAPIGSLASGAKAARYTNAFTLALPAAAPVITAPPQGFQRQEMPLPVPPFNCPAPEPVTETAPASQPAPAAIERPVLASRKQIKHAARLLIEARVSRERVEAFRKEGALGQWTLQDVEDRVNEMIHGPAVAV